jgi:hypothetical protein
MTSVNEMNAINRERQKQNLIEDETPRRSDKVMPLVIHRRKSKRYQPELEQEARDSEFNNMGREEVTKDFADSKFSDRV